MSQNRGVRIDFARLDHERQRRGLTAADLARIAGVTPATLSNARRRGGRVNAATHLKLSIALTRTQVLTGVDLVLPEEDRQ